MKVAAIQLSAGTDTSQAVEKALGFVRQAAAEGARLVALPEYFTYYGPEETWAGVAKQGEDILSVFGAASRELGVFILAGSVLLPSGEPDKSQNVSVMFGPDGKGLARYAKTHLFDADTEAGSYRESRWLTPGDGPKTTVVDDWTLGFSLCFELRFPGHFTTLRHMGAHIIAVPSAFTGETGEEHWLTLVKCRAMDSQCYMLAPALAGRVGPKRCFGHTVIVDPWGRVLNLLETGEGVALADVSLETVVNIRKAMPLYLDPV
ncbi:MAG: carbon-nitrogen hydrolase family protein [Nitrospinae bacterium]|nr:carbon-nitrogen hydrolase family protein [Nitrospinota bacterium]